MKIKLSNNKTISNNGKCFIIAEAGVNHNGNLKIGKQLIDLAVVAGADAVKFQTFVADEIILKDAPKAKYHIETTGSDQKLSWYDLLKTQEINFKMHKELINYCKKKKIIFMSTPYDKKSVDLLCRLNVEIFKIASTDSNNYQLIEYIAKKKKPVILSTAMSGFKEIQKSVMILKKYLKKNFALMQCTGSYPAPIQDANLRVIETFRKKFQCLVGYSDHVLGDSTAIASISFGISCYEKHITINKKLPGPDHRASLNKSEFIELVKKIRLTETALGNGVKKIMPSEKNNVKKLKKYLVATKDILKGQKIKPSDITAKRTGGMGISANHYFAVINKISLKNFKKNSILKK
jgi:N,N'-diacetyllegionaminate synthase